MIYEVYLKHPFTMVLSGPTGCGKTMWIKQLILSHNLCSYPPPSKIYYFYGEYQAIFSDLPSVTFIQGLSQEHLNKIQNQNKPSWIIIDDLMHEATSSNAIADLFTKGSHHRNISVILLVQNFSNKTREMRNITLNAHYLVIFKNPRDKSLSTHIARQMYPDSIKKFQNIFIDATKEPYSYLFIDLKPNTPDEIRLLTRIWNTPIIVYAI